MAAIVRDFTDELGSTICRRCGELHNGFSYTCPGGHNACGSRRFLRIRAVCEPPETTRLGTIFRANKPVKVNNGRDEVFFDTGDAIVGIDRITDRGLKLEHGGFIVYDDVEFEDC